MLYGFPILKGSSLESMTIEEIEKKFDVLVIKRTYVRQRNVIFQDIEVEGKPKMIKLLNRENRCKKQDTKILGEGPRRE